MTGLRSLSARNPRVVRLARLARRRADRREEQAFVVEGPVLVAEALAAAWPLEEAFVESSRGAEPSLAALVGRLEATGVPVWEVPDGALERAADVATSQGVLAVAGWPEAAAPTTDHTDLVVVLVDVGDPGNAGTLLRAAEAAGAGAVVFGGSSVDPTNPKCVRASAGAIFHVPVRVDADAVAVLHALGRAGFRRLATVVRGGPAYDEVDLTGPIALVLGSEAHGLSAGVLAATDEPITVPMAGRSESLNVAMAGSVIAFEALRQRRSQSGAAR
ncbi:MAG TPA: RNA methyltransferase [Acidimicrobiales bacterium]